ncbi:6-phosphogluconate dehydrogenase, decarboxylating 3, partial [Mucuna pruriens]
MAEPTTRIGLAGLAVMGQNLALNIAEKGFPISVYNRTTSKVDETVERAQQEGNLPVYGYHDPEAFVHSIQKPRVIIMLVKAGAPVDQTIKTLSAYMEKGDCIIDGGNEWYENTERREKEVAELGLLYLGMGVSGGEEGARNGPSLMPGGSFEAFKYIEDILLNVAAQVPESGPCVTYIGKGGSGNFVKMIHNGIEYGDMQLIAEAYDVLKSVGKLSNEELQSVFSEWNRGELLSFLIEITADIFGIKDDKADGYLVDKVLDKTGMKGTGKWTVQQAAELSVAAPTIQASLDARFLSGLKEERVEAAKFFKSGGFDDILADQPVDKQTLIDDVRKALYAAKICSYAQGMNLIRAKSAEKGWDLKLGDLARIWKGGCIIRAIFLDRIKQAYDRNPDLANLLVDPEFAKEIIDRQSAWRRVVCLAINSGITTPGMSASLAYFDTYRRGRLPANLVQAQRDYFGAHTYERIDIEGSYHTEWFKLAKHLMFIYCQERTIKLYIADLSPILTGLAPQIKTNQNLPCKGVDDSPCKSLMSDPTYQDMCCLGALIKKPNQTYRFNQKNNELVRCSVCLTPKKQLILKLMENWSRSSDEEPNTCFHDLVYLSWRPPPRDYLDCEHRHGDNEPGRRKHLKPLNHHFLLHLLWPLVDVGEGLLAKLCLGVM